MKARKMEHFDSHEQVKNLMHTGLKEPQAEAIVKTLYSSRSSDIGTLATKDQLTLVEQKLDNKIDQVEERLNNKIDQVEERLNNKIDFMVEKILVIVKDAKFDTIKWMVGLFITMMLTMVTLVLTLYLK